MRCCALAFVLCVSFAPSVCHAANSCSWINDATAFAAVGASPDDANANSTAAPGLCTFTSRALNGLQELRITVDESKKSEEDFAARKATCGPAVSPLVAIGNEAISCSIHPDANTFGEQVIGRVRDQVFTVTLTSTTAKTPAALSDLLQKTEMIAEIISGNLF